MCVCARAQVCENVNKCERVCASVQVCVFLRRHIRCRLQNRSAHFLMSSFVLSDLRLNKSNKEISFIDRVVPVVFKDL